jgi:glycosyltransferase involved in cell wall biosynthesis
VLPEALASLSSQAYRDFEAIVVDDESGDSTFGIAEDQARRDARFIALRLERNAGSAAARNRGLQCARGEWIAFLDADDVWMPEKLSSQVEQFRRHPESNFLFTNFWKWDGGQELKLGYTKPRKFPEGCPRSFWFGNLYFTSTVMVPREALAEAGGFDPELRMGQDWDLWLRVAERGLRARGVWEPQMRYRVWDGNITRNKILQAEYDVRILEKALMRPQPPAQRRIYRQSLRAARSNLALARIRPMLETQPEAVPRAVFEAWRLSPLRLRWLLRYLATLWPKPLGGAALSSVVHRRIRTKW